ncbi:MAG: hypothetical protein CMP23_02575 [Rickettsiales bacterium]|nr:hypothetical protein [Rickettsiales bacterium]
MPAPAQLKVIDGGQADRPRANSGNFVPVQLPEEESLFDRSLGLALLLGLLINSALGAYLLQEHVAAKEQVAETLEFSLYEPPPPPDPEPEPLPEPEPEPKVVDMSQPPIPTATATEPEVVEEPPPPVFGLSMSSTVDSGAAFTARVGNTLMKKPEEEITPPSEVRALPQVSFHKLEEPPRLIRDFRADYPLSAKEGGFQGTVIMKLTINEQGVVTAVKVVRGVQDELDAAARSAAFKFRFKPGRSDGEPVITTGFVYRYTWIIEE